MLVSMPRRDRGGVVTHCAAAMAQAMRARQRRLGSGTGGSSTSMTRQGVEKGRGGVTEQRGSGGGA
jgi:hypothetical protein